MVNRLSSVALAGRKLRITLAWHHILVIGLALVLFLWGANCQSQRVNTDMNTIDQDAYREYAKQLVETNYQAIGDRNRMPVYPYVMSLFYRPGMSDEQFFATAKSVNVVIALLVILVTFFMFRRAVAEPDALAATLVAAFTVFAYKAPFFQAEVLFYGVSFVLFALMIQLIVQPGWPVAIAAGVVAGTAHLTKASVLPGILLCCLCLAIRTLILLVQDYRRQRNNSALGIAWSRVTKPVVSGILFFAIFLAVIFPYIRTSKAQFGHYFYNVNSTFYMWYDSWQEVKEGTRAHGDRVGWPDLPDEQIPSLGKYLREHTVQQVLERFVQGLVIIRDMAFTAYGYALFLLFYLIFVILLIWQNRHHFLRLLMTEERAVVVFFVLAYVVGYLLLYAWYTRITYGNRFILALFLPILYGLVQVIGYAQRQNLVFQLWDRPLAAPIASVAIVLMLLVYLIAIFPYQICTVYGGF